MPLPVVDLAMLPPSLRRSRPVRKPNCLCCLLPVLIVLGHPTLMRLRGARLVSPNSCVPRRLS